MSLTNKHPRVAYADKHHPLSDTAIFSCANVPGFDCSIIRVDDRSTWNHYNGGRTLWVRVLPGKHNIGVIASNKNAINWLSFDIKDVQPDHAYSIEIADAPPPTVVPGHAHKGKGSASKGSTSKKIISSSMIVSYKDLGRMDSYTIRVGVGSIHPKDLTARF